MALNLIQMFNHSESMLQGDRKIAFRSGKNKVASKGAKHFTSVIHVT